jgi:hypothetical protein
MASDCYVLVLTLQVNFLAKRRFGDQVHILPNFWENMASDCYVLVLTLQFNFVAKRRFGDQVHIWPNFGENMASDCYVLVSTLHLNFIAKPRFGDQAHIWPNFGEKYGLRLLCSVVNFAMKLYCKMSIWWSGPHLTKFRSKRWPPILMFCCELCNETLLQNYCMQGGLQCLCSLRSEVVCCRTWDLVKRSTCNCRFEEASCRDVWSCMAIFMYVRS